jgi:hypothetical protein
MSRYLPCGKAFRVQNCLIYLRYESVTFWTTETCKHVRNISLLYKTPRKAERGRPNYKLVRRRLLRMLLWNIPFKRSALRWDIVRTGGPICSKKIPYLQTLVPNDHRSAKPVPLRSKDERFKLCKLQIQPSFCRKQSIFSSVEPKWDEMEALRTVMEDQRVERGLGGLLHWRFSFLMCNILFNWLLALHILYSIHESTVLSIHFVCKYI